MARRRAFGEVERRTNASGVSYRARYAMPDGTRYSRSFQTKMDAEAWLSTERALIDRDEWSPPAARKAAAERREREAATNTVRAFSKRYLAERGLRPNTVRGYQSLLDSRIRSSSSPMTTFPDSEEGSIPTICRTQRRTCSPRTVTRMSPMGSGAGRTASSKS